MRTLNRLFSRLEGRPYHPAPLLFVVLAVGIGRTVEEIYFGRTILDLNIASQYASFYLATLFGFAAIAAVLLRLNWKQTSQTVVYGTLLGLLPPLIDVFWRGPGLFRYRYLDRFYPTLHGAGNPYSEVITAWLGLGIFALYLFLRGRSLGRAVIGLGLAYLYLVLTVIEPNPLKALLDPIRPATIRPFAYLFLSYGLYVALHFRRFKPSLKRINHSLPWVLLVFLGASLAKGIDKVTWLHAFLVLLVHQGAVFANDYYDRSSDELNQRAGLLEKDDVWMVHALILWLAVHVCFADVKIGYLYLLYLLFTTAYHHPLSRFKDVFPLNYAIEGLVASLALLIGMASTKRFEFTGTELLYPALAFAGFAAASPFKDYKDIPGDRATGTRTLYVLLEKCGWSAERTHVWVSAVLVVFMAVPLFLLHLRKAPPLIVASLFAGFVVPLFFSLRRGRRTAAVERSAWLISGYLAALVLVLRFAVPPPGPGLLKDYGNLVSAAESYSSAHPSSVEGISGLVRKANQDRTRIRVRGKGHSMNGSSLPRDRELVLFTDQLREYSFEEPGSVTVGAGVGMYELRSFLENRSFHLPVTPDGVGGPSVGGYIAAGGIGPGSRLYGGFWENVLEITLVTGAGDVLKLRPGDELFPWVFGSMGQLGFVASAKLKILDAENRSYPSNERGSVPVVNAGDARHLYWFTLFVPKEELETVEASLEKIKVAHPDALEYRPNYVYPITFVRFNPKLVFPRDEDFVGVGIWGYPKSDGPSPLMAVEKDVMELAEAHRDVPYRRYIQSEAVAPDTDYEAYFGTALYNELSGYKKKLDPNFLLNCGTVFACPPP